MLSKVKPSVVDGITRFPSVTETIGLIKQWGKVSQFTEIAQGEICSLKKRRPKTTVSGCTTTKPTLRRRVGRRFSGKRDNSQAETQRKSSITFLKLYDTPAPDDDTSRGTVMRRLSKLNSKAMLSKNKSVRGSKYQIVKKEYDLRKISESSESSSLVLSTGPTAFEFAFI
jgi:hypothetical protein